MSENILQLIREIQNNAQEIAGLNESESSVKKAKEIIGSAYILENEILEVFK